MNNFDYKNMTPFKWFVLENFPFIENAFEAIDNYRLFSKVVEYLNKTIDNMNLTGEQMENVTNAMTNLQNYVNNYFDNLDVQDEINNKLDEMATDGTLKNILDELLIYEKLSKTDNQQMSNLTLQRIMRTLEKNANDPTNVAGEDYATLQGGTYTGNNKMIIARIRRNNLNETLLQEISLNTGLVIRETKLPLAHANGITFDIENNKLYVASLILNIDNVNVQQHDIFVINYNDFTIEKTITLSQLLDTEGVHSVSYDIITKKMYIQTEDTAKLNAITLYELNLENYELTKINLPDETGLLSTTNNNDMLVYNNIYYLLKFNPQVILCYDLETLKLRNIYNIDNVTNLGNTVGELENISIKYDTELKNIVLSSNHIECTNGYYNMFQYFECNPVYNICNNTQLNRYITSKDLYVDINSTAINPDGTTGKKFKHISEALEISQKTNGFCFIHLADGIYPYVYFNGSNSTIIIGGNNTNKTAVQIQGMYLDFVKANMYMYAFVIANNKNNLYDIEIDGCSRVRLGDIAFTNDLENHIRLRRSVLEFINLTWNNKLLYCESDPIVHCLNENPQYNFSNQKPNFYKKIKLFENIVFTSLNEIKTLTIPDKIKGVLDFNGEIEINLHGYYHYDNKKCVYSNNKNIRNVSCWIAQNFMDFQFQYVDENTFTIKLLTAKTLTNNGEWTNLTNINFDISLYYL